MRSKTGINLIGIFHCSGVIFHSLCQDSDKIESKGGVSGLSLGDSLQFENSTDLKIFFAVVFCQLLNV